MEERHDALEAFRWRRLTREEIQTSSDQRNREHAQRDGAPEFLLEVEIVKEGSEQRACAHNIRLPGKLRITNPAICNCESDGENNPAHRDPGCVQRFLENPSHHACARPGVSNLRGA